MKKVFISYAREDAEAARKLHRDLEQAGFEPWLDEENLLAGENWRSLIPREIKASDYVILLISSQSVVKRGFVQVEMKRALDALEEFPDSDIYIIPARLDDCEIPDRLKDYHAVDLFPKYEAGLNKIIQSLEAERVSDQKTVPPPAPPNLEPPGIYVSYAICDNDRGWVADFTKHLKSELTKRLGKADAFSLTMDHEAVDETTNIPAKILQSINDAAFFIAIVSPGFIHSDRCSRELHTFSRTAESRKDARVLVIEREPVSDAEKPEPLRRVRPSRCWKQGDEGYPKTFDKQHSEYFDLITRLSYELAGLIKCIEPPEAPPECKPEPQKDLPPVFLAEVPENLLPLRDEIEAYLSQMGIRAIPENPIPLTDDAAFRKAVKKELESCRVFVQLLDGQAGKSRALASGICRPQFEAAKKSGKVILQWRHPKLDVDGVSDADQRELLNGKDVMAVSLEEFKGHVRDSAKFKAPVQEKKEDFGDPLVFINVHETDSSHGEQVRSLLHSKSVAHVLPVWKKKQSENIKQLRQFILNTDGMIVIYGDISDDWVLKQIFYCERLKYSRKNPLRAWAVYDAPPTVKTGLDFDLSDSPKLHVINCRDCFDEERFKPFFDDLRKGGRP